MEMEVEFHSVMRAVRSACIDTDSDRCTAHAWTEHNLHSLYLRTLLILPLFLPLLVISPSCSSFPLFLLFPSPCLSSSSSSLPPLSLVFSSPSPFPLPVLLLPSPCLSSSPLPPLSPLGGTSSLAGSDPSAARATGTDLISSHPCLTQRMRTKSSA